MEKSLMNRIQSWHITEIEKEKYLSELDFLHIIGRRV